MSHLHKTKNAQPITFLLQQFPKILLREILGEHWAGKTNSNSSSSSNLRLGVSLVIIQLLQSATVIQVGRLIFPIA